MVLHETRSRVDGDILPCFDCVAAYGSNVCELMTGVMSDMSARICPALMSFKFFGNCDDFFDRLLLGGALVAALFWFVLPQGWWEDWLCGHAMAALSLVCFSLWRVLRELRMRHTFERSAQLLVNENEALKKSSDQLRGDLDMLQDTIGKRSPAHKRPQPSVHRAPVTVRRASAPHFFTHTHASRVRARDSGAIGDKGDDWLGQLRGLYHSQKRENDRQAFLLRGHARIVLLQLIQHFDSDHTMTLNTTELAAAEAFLTAGFPDIDIAQLEGKAASGGVTIADLEPLLQQELRQRGQGSLHRPVLPE